MPAISLLPFEPAPLCFMEPPQAARPETDFLSMLMLEMPEESEDDDVDIETAPERPREERVVLPFVIVTPQEPPAPLPRMCFGWEREVEIAVEAKAPPPADPEVVVKQKDVALELTFEVEQAPEAVEAPVAEPLAADTARDKQTESADVAEGVAPAERNARTERADAAERVAPAEPNARTERSDVAERVAPVARDVRTERADVAARVARTERAAMMTQERLPAMPPVVGREHVAAAERVATMHRRADPVSPVVRDERPQHAALPERESASAAEDAEPPARVARAERPERVELEPRERETNSPPDEALQQKQDRMPMEQRASAPAARPVAEKSEARPSVARAEPVMPVAQTPKSSAIREIAIRVPGADSNSVDVHLVDRRGKVQVEVLTNDTRLAASLRDNVGDLVDRLRSNGHTPGAETARAVEEKGSATGLVSMTERTEMQETKLSAGKEQPTGDGGAPQHQGQQQHGHHRGNRSRWVEEMLKYAQFGSEPQEEEAYGGN